MGIKMALVDFKYFSPVLGMQTALTIILPENTQGIGVGGLQEKSDAPIPALYLLYPCSWILTALAEIAYFASCYKRAMAIFRKPAAA